MAIEPRLARKWAESHDSPDSLRREVTARLLAPDPLPIGNGRIEEFAEDVVLELLRDEGLGEDLREAVAHGWRDARHELQSLLTEPSLSDEEREKLRRPFTRVFRVAEATGNPELRRSVRDALALVAADEPLVTRRQVQQVVAAAMEYLDDIDLGLWKRLLRTRREVAVYAFEVLLKLDRANTEEYLLCLIEKRYVGHPAWSRLRLDVLAEYANQAGKRNAVEQALSQFYRQHSDAWDELCEDISKASKWLRDMVMRVQQSGQVVMPKSDLSESGIVDTRATSDTAYSFEIVLDQLHKEVTSTWPASHGYSPETVFNRNYKGPGITGQHSSFQCFNSEFTAIFLRTPLENVECQDSIARGGALLFYSLEKEQEVRLIPGRIRKDAECQIRNR